MNPNVTLETVSKRVSGVMIRKRINPWGVSIIFWGCVSLADDIPQMRKKSLTLIRLRSTLVKWVIMRCMELKIPWSYPVQYIVMQVMHPAMIPANQHVWHSCSASKQISVIVYICAIHNLISLPKIEQSSHTEMMDSIISLSLMLCCYGYIKNQLYDPTQYVSIMTVPSSGFPILYCTSNITKSKMNI